MPMGGVAPSGSQEPRAASRPVVAKLLRSFLLAILVPGLLFALVGSARRGICLEAYQWEGSEGFVPAPDSCSKEVQTTFGEAGLFYARAFFGMSTGRSGRSREDASMSVAVLLGRRGLRSVGVLGVALVFLGALGLGTRGLSRRNRRLPMPRAGFWGFLDRGLSTLSHLAPPGGLPLPIAGLVVFVAVLRIVPAGSIFDYDRAGILWAGLALALADGAGAILIRGLRHARAVERSRRYADALVLWGCDPEPAVAEVSRRVRASQVRGALLALLGGLLVVEGVFGVNGLGETLCDLVVDRQGLDPLLLSAVLVTFAGVVLAVEWLPIERMLSFKGVR